MISKEFSNPITKPYCKKCGYPALSNIPFCNLCANMSFYKLRSCFLYKAYISELIVGLKYHHQFHAFFKIKNLLNNINLAAYYDFSSFDFLLPIPSDIKTYWGRGFNQALLLSKIISKKYHVPVQNSFLLKRNVNKKQKNLTRLERKNQVNPFYVRTDVFLNKKKILLFDDVATTLNTLNFAAQCLRRAGASHVCALTLARTPYKN